MKQLAYFLGFWLYAAAADSLMDAIGPVRFVVLGLALLAGLALSTREANAREIKSPRRRVNSAREEGKVTPTMETRTFYHTRRRASRGW